MRFIWIVLLVVGLFAANRWWNEGSASIATPRSVTASGDTQPGGAVRQLQRQPTDLMDMGAAMPAAGGGSSAAMLDTARGAAR